LFSALATLLLVLLLLPLVAAVTGRQRREFSFVMSALCGLGALLSLVFLVFALPSSTQVLPIASGGIRPSFTFDSLSMLALLVVYVSSAVAFLSASSAKPRELALLAVLVVSLCISLLAADIWLLFFGLQAITIALWSIGTYFSETRQTRRVLMRQSAVFSLGAFAFFMALVLLTSTSSHGADELRFAVLNATEIPFWQRELLPAVLMLAAAAFTGLVPMHAWFADVIAGLPVPYAIVASVGLQSLALDLLERIMFGFGWNAISFWWGVIFGFFGAASAFLGSFRSLLASEMAGVLAADVQTHSGFTILAFGVALIAHSADLPSLADLSLAAAWLGVLSHAVWKTLFFLVADTVWREAGSRKLARLGGLIHCMPVTTTMTLIAGGCMANLPLWAGFAPIWLFMKSLYSVPRLYGLGLQISSAVMTAFVGFALALECAAAVRVVGVGFLGRFRTPRAAAAEDARGPIRPAMFVLSGLALVIGFFPGVTLRLVEPSLQDVVGQGLGTRLGFFVLHARDGESGYAAIGIFALFGIAFLVGAAILQRLTSSAQAYAARWEGGFTATPAWLPFGDPLTQYGPASFTQPFAKMFATALIWSGMKRELCSSENPHTPVPRSLAQGNAAEESLAPAPRLWSFFQGRRRRAALQKLRRKFLSGQSGAVLPWLLLFALFAVWLWQSW